VIEKWNTSPNQGLARTIDLQFDENACLSGDPLNLSVSDLHVT
jgi:hypothetical protein